MMPKKKKAEPGATLKKFRVCGTVTISVTYTVEAEDEASAIEVAERDYPGLSNYCGNGRTGGALIGTTDDDLDIEAGTRQAWSSCALYCSTSREPGAASAREDSPEWVEAIPLEDDGEG